MRNKVRGAEKLNVADQYTEERQRGYETFPQLGHFIRALLFIFLYNFRIIYIPILVHIFTNFNSKHFYYDNMPLLSVESCRTLFLAFWFGMHYTITKHFISVSLFDIISGIFGALPLQKSHAFPI